MSPADLFLRRESAPIATETHDEEQRSTMIKVGLIGGGGIASAHIRGYTTHADRIAVTAIADAVPMTVERRAAELGARGFDDYRQMITEADLDAVDICLPHHLHRDAIVAAAEAGLHILCEKPLCLSTTEAAEVQQAVARAGVTLMCAHNQLFLPAVAEAKALLDAGRLGRVYEVRTTDCFHNDFDPANMGWRASAATSGGGELIDTGYHPTYLMLHLAGSVPVEAAAMLSTHRLTFAEGEDSAQVIVRFENGAVGTLWTSWAYDPPEITERFSVVAEHGTLHSDGTSLHVRYRSGETASTTYDAVDTFVAEIGHFADSLIAGGRPLHTEKEGIEALGMILAGYESARTRTIAPVLRAAPAASEGSLA
ncbi:MAG TPA: Gfo/Idh/MocA family oxidoreductase [Microlunatus sp.]